MEIVTANFFDSGGYCYIYFGKLDDCRYYSLGSDILLILKKDYGETLTDEFFEETGGDTYDWEQENIIEQYEIPLTDKEMIKLGKAIFAKLKEKYPKGDWDRICKSELGLQEN